jgi:hypothetical protein
MDMECGGRRGGSGVVEAGLSGDTGAGAVAEVDAGVWSWAEDDGGVWGWAESNGGMWGWAESDGGVWGWAVAVVRGAEGVVRAAGRIVGGRGMFGLGGWTPGWYEVVGARIPEGIGSVGRGSSAPGRLWSGET